jgi:hypothetical protein
MKIPKKSAKKVLSLLSKLSDKEVAEAGAKASTTKKNKVDAERIREALEERLADNPQYLDTLSDDEYIDLMDALPEKERLKMLGDDYGVEIAESQEGMMTSMTPKEAANSLELFTGASEVSQYLNTLDAKGLKEFKENVNEADVDLYGPALDRLESTGPRVVKAEGGSMLVPPEREEYSKGGRVGELIVSMLRKNVKQGKKPTRKQIDTAVVETKETYPNLIKKLTKENKEDEKSLRFFENYATGGGGKTDLDSIIASLKDNATESQEATKPLVRKQKTYRSDMAKNTAGTAGVTMLLLEGPEAVKDVYESLTESKRDKFESAFSEAHNAGENTFLFDGKEYTTDVAKGREAKAFGGIIKLLKEKIKTIRKAEVPSINEMEASLTPTTMPLTMMSEGGSMLLPPELQDTYDNIPEDEKEEAEKSQLPDSEMEDNYLQFILNESLEEDDQDYLMDVLEQDERLSSIFDQVMDVAGEFSGEGEVDGPGTGVSDSIPARLSDGEFVFTRKATDQLGAEQLQTMMDDAERAYDGGLMKKAFGGIAYNPMGSGKMTTRITEDELTEEEIKRQMISSNRMPSVNPR